MTGLTNIQLLRCSDNGSTHRRCVDVTAQRRAPDSFEHDEAEDDFSISLSIWPEGLPQAALGSRRFTGLGQSTSLQNN